MELGIGSTGGRGLTHKAGVPVYALHGAALVSTIRTNVQAVGFHASKGPGLQGDRARTSGHQRQTLRAGADIPDSATLSSPPCLLGPSVSLRTAYDPGRTRTCNLWFRRSTPYPLGHRAFGLRAERGELC